MGRGAMVVIRGRRRALQGTRLWWCGWKKGGGVITPIPPANHYPHR